jgi:hypothetical protein
MKKLAGPAWTGALNREHLIDCWMQSFFLWRNVQSTAHSFILWWWKLEIRFDNKKRRHAMRGTPSAAEEPGGVLLPRRVHAGRERAHGHINQRGRGWLRYGDLRSY